MSKAWYNALKFKKVGGSQTKGKIKAVLVCQIVIRWNVYYFNNNF